MKLTSNLPTKDGEYLMKDSGGGPTLYLFKTIDGEMMCAPKSRIEKGKSYFEAECMLEDAEYKALQHPEDVKQYNDILDNTNAGTEALKEHHNTK